MLKLIKKLLTTNWIKIYIEYRSILKMIAMMTRTNLDDNTLKFINDIINSIELGKNEKEAISKKLTKSKLIPDIQVSYSDKKGFEAKTTFSI